MQLAHHLLGSLLGVMVNSMSLEPDRGGLEAQLCLILCCVPYLSGSQFSHLHSGRSKGAFLAAGMCSLNDSYGKHRHRPWHIADAVITVVMVTVYHPGLEVHR